MNFSTADANAANLWTQTRRVLFKLSIASITTSLAVLVGSYLRHPRSTDYLEQANEATPWILWGLGAGLLGFILSLFGRRYTRLVAAIFALGLFTFWVLIGESVR